MNLSHEHKVIWWTKPEMGEKLVASAFESLNFVTSSYAGVEIPTSKQKISFIDKIPPLCEDYSLIMSVRNPYYHIINYYLRISETNWKLKINTKENFIKSMNNWVSEIFSVDEKILLGTDSGLQHIFPYNIDKRQPDFVLKFENIRESLTELFFLMNINFQFNEHLLKNNEEFEVNTLSYENASKIYKVFKKHFDNFNYDPFSFTDKELSLKDKVNFIHN